MANISDYQVVPVEKLVPYVNNAKRHSDAQITRIAASIREFGFLAPIVIDRENNIIAGHGRVEAAKKLGIEAVPAVLAEGLTEAQRKAYILADNRLTELGEWDMELVNLELESLEGLDFDTSLTGFELEQESPQIVEDDYEETEEMPPRSKVGELWQLGEHRLFVGDSTNAKNIKILMDGKLADLWLTDPPYNVNYKGTAGTIQNDNQEEAQFRAFLQAANEAAAQNMKPGAAFYIWHADSEGLNFRIAANESGLRVRECLIWVKNSFVLGHSDYQWQHEPCLYGWKDGAAHYFTDSRSESTVIPDLHEINPKKMRKEELVDLLSKILSEDAPTTVIKMDKPSRNEDHPTMKPVALFDYLIRNSTKKGELVLDSFAGSGTTVMACEQDGRKARVMELDPKYADVIIRRWEKFTGKEAVLL